MIGLNAYLAAKELHIACVVVSAVGFFLRGIWMLCDSPMLQRRWVKILPHINDTLLLAAAIALCVLTGQYPLVQAWVTAKVFGLIGYIILGSIALSRLGPRRGKAVRAVNWLAALALFGYIASVALTKDARGFFGFA